MKQGRTLAEVMQQVEKEAKAKRDLIVPAQSLFMGDEGDCIGIHNKNSTERFAPNTLFHHQMASALNIPTKFYDYLAQTHPELLVLSCRSVTAVWTIWKLQLPRFLFSLACQMLKWCPQR